MDEYYELVVKAQLNKTLCAYQDDDGTVDLTGWLADACLALNSDEPGRDWKAWAYYVIGHAALHAKREAATPDAAATTEAR